MCSGKGEEDIGVNGRPRNGVVFDIQRYSIDDGPGIRTLVFMKGCPLRCMWCSNPEGQRFEPSLLFIERLCTGCLRCTGVCPTGAATSSDHGMAWARDLCDECFKCTEVCEGKARQVCGKSFTVEQLLDEVERDRPFYRRSGGGVTLGGGEPLGQPEFCRDFLREAKRRNLHTAMETCGYARWSHLRGILEYTDLLFMDIKHMDPVQHRKLTGKSNELILENIRRASKEIGADGEKIVIRVPVIPTLNDSEDNIRATAEFVRALGAVNKIELLPFHNMGQVKYERTKWTGPYALHALEPMGGERLRALKGLVESNGLSAEIGE